MQTKIQKQFGFTLLAIILVIIVLIIAGGVIFINSKKEYKEVANLGLPGGCWGTSMIKDLKIEPKNLCLAIWANNCNGGVLEIDNNCSQDVKIGNLNIPKYDGHDTYVIEFKKDSTGNITVDKASGNYATYEPSKDEEMLISGNIGKEKFTIYYLKKINQSRENMY